MRIAHINNGVVVNVIEADTVWSSNGADSYMASDTASIGWTLIDGALQPEPIDPLVAAERFIESYFSTARLLQCKVWFDLIPHTSTPKLLSLFQWSGVVTSLAATQLNPVFPLPPVTFQEIVQECIPLLNS